MEEFFEAVFFAFFEALAEEFVDFIVPIIPQKNIKKKTREKIKIAVSMYAVLSFVFLIVGIVLLVEFLKYKVLGIVFICNFVLLLIAGIVSKIVRKIKGDKNEKSS